MSAIVLESGTPADQFAAVNQSPVPSIQTVVWEKAGAQVTSKASNPMDFFFILEVWVDVGGHS